MLGKRQISRLGPTSAEWTTFRRATPDLCNRFGGRFLPACKVARGEYKGWMSLGDHLQG